MAIESNDHIFMVNFSLTTFLSDAHLFGTVCHVLVFFASLKYARILPNKSKVPSSPNDSPLLNKVKCYMTIKSLAVNS